jgi:hypothetical protein
MPVVDVKYFCRWRLPFFPVSDIIVDPPVTRSAA